jgi:hypothetical protein
VKPLFHITLLGLLCAATAARAQLALPQLPAPLPQPGAVLREVVPAVPLVQPVLSSVRERARALTRRYPREVERDPRGAPVVRAVILALSPDEQALQQALA